MVKTGAQVPRGYHSIAMSYMSVAPDSTIDGGVISVSAPV